MCQMTKKKKKIKIIGHFHNRQKKKPAPRMKFKFSRLFRLKVLLKVKSTGFYLSCEKK